MSEVEYRRTMRSNIVGDLTILASPREQIKYHNETPVDVASEMVCAWFDNHYRINESTFAETFAPDEWKAISEFSAILGAFAADFDYQNHPTMEKLLQNSDWKRVIEAAKVALFAFR